MKFEEDQTNFKNTTIFYQFHLPESAKFPIGFGSDSLISIRLDAWHSEAKKLQHLYSSKQTSSYVNLKLENFDRLEYRRK